MSGTSSKLLLLITLVQEEDDGDDDDDDDDGDDDTRDGAAFDLALALLAFAGALDELHERCDGATGASATCFETGTV